MKRAIPLSLLLLVAHAAFGQRYKINVTESPEGTQLNKVLGEADDAKRRVLLEEFLAKFSANENTPWVTSQLLQIVVKTNEPDKVIELGTKLLAADPTDTDAALNCLKAAEAKKDAALIQKWAAKASELARKMAAAPEPKDAEEAETWKKQVDYAKQVDIYTEYALFNGGNIVTDNAQKIALFEALEKQNAKSQYVGMSQPYLFSAYDRAGDKPKALAIADKLLAADPKNDDMLLYLATYNFENMRDKDKALNYSTRLMEAAPTRQAPQGIAADEWKRRADSKLALGGWMAGVLYATNNKWAETDKYLRIALPVLPDNKELQAEVLFYLGLANYNLAQNAPNRQQRLADALKYSQQCAAIPGKYQAQARKNVTAIQGAPAQKKR